jgi:aminoglycoside phosphotransferase (APT) family kinase protein
VRRWRARAAEALGQAPAMARRLDGLRDALEEVAALVGAQPPTLVHNDLAPKNIVADTAHDPPRICLVDWETAGVGCASLDLAHLLHGLEQPAGERLVARYADAAPGLLAAGDEGARVVAACRAHKTVYRLAHPALWSRRPALAQMWLDELELDLRIL